MNILFVADPLESFKIYKDTTFAMMREAQRRGHRISACETQDISWQTGGKVSAQGSKHEYEASGSPPVIRQLWP